MTMRKPNLISCYAAASSMASTRRAYRSSAVAGFASPHWQRAGGAGVEKHMTHAPSCCNPRSRPIVVSNRMQARQLGSKSGAGFRQQFLKSIAKSQSEEDEDDGEPDEYDEEADANPHNFQPPNETVRSQTLNWLKKVVIGYNLCPFAERPLREDKLRISVVRGSDDEYVASAVVYELISRSTKPGTTVLVAPEYYPDDFERYMSLVQYIEEDIMDEHELHGVLQIAPFHPQFEFAGSGKEGIDNFTNRSPYPIFHILREDEVEGAVAKLGGDASKVWGRNVRLLEGMEERWGREGVERAMRGEMVDGMDSLLKEVKLASYSDMDKDDES